MRARAARAHQRNLVRLSFDAFDFRWMRENLLFRPVKPDIINVDFCNLSDKLLTIIVSQLFSSEGRDSWTSILASL